MDREIKFRAWDKNDAVMRDWENLMAIVYSQKSDNIFNDKGLILMQYTGLKDRNENEIYEGDIIKCTVTDNSADYLQIEAGDKHSVLRIISIPDLYQEGLSDDGEIIGNIYENNNLLGR